MTHALTYEGEEKADDAEVLRQRAPLKISAEMLRDELGHGLRAAAPTRSYHEPEEPRRLVIAGNTGNVVCNTSFTDLSDSRVKTEIAKADVAELQQLFDSVEAKQAVQAPGHERGPEAGLRLGTTLQEQSGRI